MERFKKIFENNERWVAEKLALDPDYFTKLAQGQNPDMLYIGCSDSRVTTEDLMGVQPGEVFVHRNIANMVISTDTSVNAVVQFAVEQLKVKHIVVCGHYKCGGVRAALNQVDMGQLNGWLQTLRNVYRLHNDELQGISDPELRFDRLVELNVLEQCINVSKIDHVQHSWRRSGFPKIHGWIFNTSTGKLIDLELDMDEIFSSFSNIYGLKPQV